MQETWRDVAYDGLNSAVAGALSKVAVASVQRTALSIFVDFPGNDSFETVFNTITRGDVEKAHGMFTMTRIKITTDNGPTGIRAEKSTEAAMDQTRSGRPTKRMLQQIKKWDPNLDLQRAAVEERIKWRRAYTINWLYDLVNLFSGVVIQRNLEKGENHILERVDWFINGPRDKVRVLYGVNEFAGFVTTLAMQKPNSPNIKSRILPQHVFQLQLIVDSMTATRGWTVGMFQGHIVVPPPRNPSFRARRCHILPQILLQNGQHYGRSRHDQHEDICAHLERFQHDMTNWLVDSKYKFGLDGIATLRFSNTNTNGLWEYNPICHSALLQHQHQRPVGAWHRLLQIMLLVHLHNMLVKKGYIHTPLGLYGTVEHLFRERFFKDGQVPFSNFAEALVHRQQMESFSPQQMTQPGSHEHKILAVERNAIFKQNSMLTLFHHADWNMDLIPEEKIPIPSVFGGLRLAKMKQIVDPATGKKKLEETPLVRRARKSGLLDEAIANISAVLPQIGVGRAAAIGEMMYPGAREAVSALFPPGYDIFRPGAPLGSLFFCYCCCCCCSCRNSSNNKTAPPDLDPSETLEVLKINILRDVCGSFPVSSFNYIWCTARLLVVFGGIEVKLREMRNETYMHVYENPANPPGLPTLQQKWFGLVFETLQRVDGTSRHSPRDEECLGVIVREMQNQGTPGFLSHCYWDGLVPEVTLEATTKRRQRETGMRRDGT
ncbi:hypothetical protein B0H66DRAFT_636443 [Apodospora peruviana]|uniref:Uncharacterized protein n=1 Tax=Apodospora peruviana TaxID=516989 RepID=A0AAE0IH11_9PEZI|nr:hypothetical protein B0H66DRAFT_636443 [Apodospora peruviana]